MKIGTKIMEKTQIESNFSPFQKVDFDKLL